MQESVSCPYCGSKMLSQEAVEEHLRTSCRNKRAVDEHSLDKHWKDVQEVLG